MVDNFRFCGFGSFFVWTYCPQRRLFENKVIHPLSFECSLPPTFSPQDYRRRKRLKLKSLAWARHQKERLQFHPRVYAKHAVNARDWRESAQLNPWEGLWDKIPYELWGWDPSHWYNQKYHLDSFDGCLTLDSFCSSLDPIRFHRFERATNVLAFETSLPTKQKAFIAADRIRGSDNSCVPSAKFYSITEENTPIVIDSGASMSISPFAKDFVGEFTRFDKQVDGISEEVAIEGVGDVEWTVLDSFGKKGTIRTTCYLMPRAKIRLFSPQKYLQDTHSDGTYFLNSSHCTLDLVKGPTLKFVYDKFNNLPLAPTFKPTEKTTSLSFVTSNLPEGVQCITLLEEETNKNLTRAQKELLHWHWRLGHASQKRVQGLMRKNVHTNEQIIVPSVQKASSCDRPMCSACRLARANRNLAHLQSRHPAPDMIIRVNDLVSLWTSTCATLEEDSLILEGRKRTRSAIAVASSR